MSMWWALHPLQWDKQVWNEISKLGISLKGKKGKWGPAAYCLWTWIALILQNYTSRLFWISIMIPQEQSRKWKLSAISTQLFQKQQMSNFLYTNIHEGKYTVSPGSREAENVTSCLWLSMWKLWISLSHCLHSNTFHVSLKMEIQPNTTSTKLGQLYF